MSLVEGNQKGCSHFYLSHFKLDSKNSFHHTMVSILVKTIMTHFPALVMFLQLSSAVTSDVQVTTSSPHTLFPPHFGPCGHKWCSLFRFLFLFIYFSLNHHTSIRLNKLECRLELLSLQYGKYPDH